MRRGFKALAERNSHAARQELGLVANAPLDPWAYAAHLEVIVLDFAGLGLETGVATQLTVKDCSSWSAMTLRDHTTYAIVINPAHARTRQRSDLMHELAHIQLGHAPSRVEVSTSGVLLLSDYSEDQEQEADWHAAALLLPRDGALQMRAQRNTTIHIANYYGVSEALCEWRLRMTGIDVQIRRAREI